MSQPSLRRIERALQTRVVDIQSQQKIWLINTNEYTWVAKQCRSVQHQDWWSQIDQELRQRGFHDMPRFIHAGDGLALTQYIHGRTCKYRSQSEVQLVLKQLACFHQAGRGCTTPSSRQAAFLLWERLGQRLRKFERYLSHASQFSGRIGRLIQSAGHEMYQMGVNVWNQLCTTPFYQMTEQSHMKHHLCHRDLASHNWIVKDQQAWLIDFDTAGYDAQWGDLWQICTRILTENHWDEAVWYKMIQCYEEYQPLSSWEKHYMKVMLGFPNEFFRESMGVMEKKPGYRYDSSVPYLERIIDDVGKWKTFISQLRHW